MCELRCGAATPRSRGLLPLHMDGGHDLQGSDAAALGRGYADCGAVSEANVSDQQEEKAHVPEAVGKTGKD